MTKRILGVVVFLLAGCGSIAEAGSLKLAWNANTEADLAGYVVMYGMRPGSYQNTVRLGKISTVEIPNLPNGQLYYFVVKAFNLAGMESAVSNAVSAQFRRPSHLRCTTGRRSAAAISTVMEEPTLQCSVRGRANGF